MNRFHTHHLPTVVAKALRGFYRVTRLYAFLRVVCVSVLLYLLLALGAMHADRLLFLIPQARLTIFWSVHVAVALYALVALLLFLWRAPSLRRTAYDLGARLPDGDGERYATLDSVLREGVTDTGPVRAELLAQLQQSTEALSRGVKPLRLVRDRRLPRLALGVLAAVGAYAALAVLPGYEFPLMVRRFLAPAANLPKPSFVHIRVSPEKLVLGRGEEAVIQAEIDGEIPPVFAWLYRLAGAAPGRCVMATAPGRAADVRVDLAGARDLNRIQRRLFIFSQAELEASFSYRLRCGDAETAVHFVEVVAQPRITELRLVAKPPAYTRRPAAEIVNPRQAVQLFPGTQVELQFTVDQEVPERRLLLGAKEGPPPKWDAATRTGRHAFTMQDKLDIEIRVRNGRGFANAERARVSLVRLDDRPPQLQLEYPAGDLTVVPGELIPVQALAEDDLEIVRAGFRFQLNPDANPDAPFQELPLSVPEPRGTRLAITENFDLGQTTAGPGDELVLVVRVRDSAGNDAESRPVRLRITAFTRGENERRRLAALTTVHDLLTGLGSQPPAAGATAIDRTLYEAIQKAAVGRGVPLDAAPACNSLWRLLELEQHFTDAARHKEDVRELGAVLAAAWEFGTLPGAEAAAPAWPLTLSRDVLAPLLRSRRLQNVTWRLFGMQYEVADIRRRLTEIDAETARQGAAQRQALEAFILGVTQKATERQDMQAALRAELDLRRQISDVKAKARPATQQEGEQVDNPFAPVQLDVEVARLKPADEKQVELLTRQLEAKVAERRRLAGAAVREAVAAGAATLKNASLGLTAKDVEILAATAFDRVLRPPADGTGATAAGPEARRILVQELVAERLKSQDGGDTAARKSLARRADLYLKALEDIGVDLAAAADGTRVLDATALKALQGELNTAGYYLNRGGQAKNVASCDEVTQLLSRLLDTVRPALPPLLREEQQARDRLHILYRAAWNRLAAAPAPALAGPQASFAHAWVETDLHMLERNPFAPLAPRLRNLALLERLDAGGSPAKAAPLVSFLDPAAQPALAGAVAAEQRASQLLALDWEVAELLAASRVSPPERQLAVRLLELTAVRLGAVPGADAGAIEKSILALPLATAVATPAADPAAFLRAARAGVDATAAEATLLKAAGDRLPLGMPLTVAAAALERAAAAVKTVDALEAALNSGDTDVAAVIARAAGTINHAVSRYEQLVRLTAVDVGYVAPLAAMAHREERFFLRVREALGRYRGRAGLAVQNLALAGGHELDAAQLGSLSADLTIIKAGVQALQSALKTAIEEYGAGDSGPKYPIQEAFAESRAWVSTATELAAAKKPADVAARFVRQFAAARLEYLGARSALLDAAAKDLRETEALAEAGSATPARLSASLTTLRQAFTAFLGAVEKAGAGPLQTRCRQDTAALLARVDKLAQTPAPADDTAQRRRLLELTELLKETERLLRRVRAEIDTGAGPQLEYAGGPDRIWLQETRLDAEVARQRLLGQLRQARRRFTLGVLEALETPPTPEVCRELQAWSLFCHRVARSPLSGVVTPPRTEAGGDSARNPLAKWLLEQLQEAASETRAEDSLRSYPGITRELIQSLKDYMRY